MYLEHAIERERSSYSVVIMRTHPAFPPAGSRFNPRGCHHLGDAMPRNDLRLLKRRTRDPEVLTLCEYVHGTDVHGTNPGFRRSDVPWTHRTARVRQLARRACTPPSIRTLLQATRTSVA